MFLLYGNYHFEQSSFSIVVVHGSSFCTVINALKKITLQRLAVSKGHTYLNKPAAFSCSMYDLLLLPIIM